MNLAGAGEVQKAFGYRFVLDSASYPLTLQPGAKLPVKLTVRNTGSAPFYLDWPVAVGLLDPATAEPVWSAPLGGVDIRKWLPGEDWDSEAFAYRRPAVANSGNGLATLPGNLKSGQYILALAILDQQGGMMPSARFVMNDLTLMLQNSDGDEKLLAEKLLPLVYDELRKLAAARMARETARQTPQPTALVHEAWLKLVHGGGRTWENRTHFYRAAALAMRRILIDRARQHLIPVSEPLFTPHARQP